MTTAEAMDRLDVIPDYDAGAGSGACVHTFVPSAVGLLGAHWYLHDVKAAFDKYGVEESGPEATAMRHGLVIPKDERGLTIFFATKEQA